MNQRTWSAVDAFIVERLVRSDTALADALAANAAAGLPSYDVSPAQGKLLHLLARMIDARRILEIGTLGGYSTIWLARALREGGLVVTLEAEAKHAAVARQNITRAGLASCVDLRVGPALATLPQIAREGLAPFDLIFIDADKASNADYLAWSLKLARPGSVIVGDNVIRNGAILDAGSADANIRGTRRFFDLLASEPRLSATVIQTVGDKGWDGFALAIVD
jgi:predicted O-methyltransferase YrrM